MDFNIKKTQIFSGSIAFYMLCVLVLLNSSCKKLVEVDPPITSITGSNVFASDPTAIAVLTGVYANMSAAGIVSGDLTSIGFLTGLSSDELTLYGGIEDTRLNYYQNRLTAASDNYSLWNICYPKIHTVNSVIEGVTNSKSLNAHVKQQLIGEAKFMRAFCYFYLVNLYGDVPLVLNTDYSINLALPRSSKDVIWNQIILDLKEAKDLLSNEFLDITLLRPTSERVRPTKWAAIALLSRAYLFTSDWKNAEIESSSLIGNPVMFHLEGLNDIFKNTSGEAIWQLQPVNVGANTEDARNYVINDFGPSNNGGVYISEGLLKSFDPNDQRKRDWIGIKNYEGIDYHFAYKYKLTTGDQIIEYHTIFRLAEQYLIRSEARAELGDYFGSIDDLDKIRSRAGLPLLKEINPEIGISDLRSAVMMERRHELFTEWGHRWLDLKRTNTIDEVMNVTTPLKGGQWSSNWKLYPIPPFDILNNNNIVQNPGY